MSVAASVSHAGTGSPEGGARIEGTRVVLTLPSGVCENLQAIWLRHNCPCSECRHANGQRLVDLLDIPEDVAPQSARLQPDGALEIVWNGDGHVSRYDATWLAAHSLTPGARAARRRRPVLWDATLCGRIPRADWPSMLRARREPASSFAACRSFAPN